MLKRSKDGRPAPGGPLIGSSGRNDAFQDGALKADVGGDPSSQKASAEAQITKDKDFQVWLKHLQDSYEQRIQPRLAEIASLRQELLSTKSELNQLKVPK